MFYRNLKLSTKMTLLLVCITTTFLIFTSCTKKPTQTTETSTDSILSRFNGQKIPGLSSTGYIDSVFVTRDASQIYFINSPYAPRVLNGSTAPGNCSTATALPGHTSTTGLEWNTDIYYVTWSSSEWSQPVNVGSPVNTLGMECCHWLSDDMLEMIFYRGTDLDGDGTDGDLGLGPSGNFRTTRASLSSPWNSPVALTGDYGTDNQSNTNYRHDIQKTPSNNYYLWELFGDGTKKLLFGNYNGSGYDAPVVISGSIHEDTQIWVNDSETQMLYNHRLGDGSTTLYKMERVNTASSWGTPSQVSTSGFADSQGATIWGEPTSSNFEKYMVFIRFNTANAQCWSSEILFSPGNTTSGYTGSSSLVD